MRMNVEKSDDLKSITTTSLEIQYCVRERFHTSSDTSLIPLKR